MECSSSHMVDSPCTNNSSTNLSHPFMLNLECLCLQLKHPPGDRPLQLMGKSTITINILAKHNGISHLECLNLEGYYTGGI
jgi:hypothetical protein